MHGGAPRAAIIISTYNWPEALALVLASVLGQTEGSVEIVVADDGSRPETGEAVRGVLGGTRVSWCHVRQEDTGFRQSRVRNLGVRYSTAPWLVFIDHDTPLHPCFLEDHLRLSSAGVFVQGKRCFLPPDRSAALLRDGLRPGWWPRPWLPGLTNRKNAVHAPALGRWLLRDKAHETSIRGCNLAVSRQAFLKVDGFDELYDGVWGREDSDFANRLSHVGIRCRNAWFCALQAHLHHRQSKRQGMDALDEELDRMRRERRTVAVRGFSKMDGEGRVMAASASYPFQKAG